MISSKAAEAMDYLTYKRTFWPLMRDWWREYLENHPERAAFVTQRIAFCDAQVRHWNGSFPQFKGAAR